MPKIMKGEEKLIRSQVRAEPGDNSGAQAAAHATNVVGMQIEKISTGYFEAARDSIENSIYNNAVTKATTEFNERYNERVQQKYDKDGNPTYVNLERDVQQIAEEVRAKYAPYILNSQTSDRFNASYEDLKMSKMLQANSEMRQQHLQVTGAQLSKSIFDLTQQMEKDPANMSVYQNQINGMLHAAVLDGTLNPVQAEGMRQGIVNEIDRLNTKATAEAEKAQAEAQAAAANKLMQRLIKGGGDGLALADSIVYGSAEQFGVSEEQFTQLLRAAQGAVITEEAKAKAEFIDIVKDKAEANPEFGKEVLGSTREEFNKKHDTNLDRADFEQMQAIVKATELEKASKVEADQKSYATQVNSYRSTLKEAIIRKILENPDSVSEADLLKARNTPINIDDVSKDVDLNNVPPEYRNQTQLTDVEYNDLLAKLREEKNKKKEKVTELDKLASDISQGNSIAGYKQDTVYDLYEKARSNQVEVAKREGREYNLNDEVAILSGIKAPIDRVAKQQMDYLLTGNEEQFTDALKLFKGIDYTGARTFDNLTDDQQALIGLALELERKGTMSPKDIMATVREAAKRTPEEKTQLSSDFKAVTKKVDKNELVSELLGVDDWGSDEVPVDIKTRVLSTLQQIYASNGGDYDAAVSTVRNMYKDVAGESELTEGGKVTFFPPEKVFKGVYSAEDLKNNLYESFKDVVPEGAEIYIDYDYAITSRKDIGPSWPVYYVHTLKDGTRIKVPLEDRWEPGSDIKKTKQSSADKKAMDKRNKELSEVQQREDLLSPYGDPTDSIDYSTGKLTDG